MDFGEYFSKFIVYLQSILAVAVDQMIECRFLILSIFCIFLQSVVGFPLILHRCYLAKIFCTKCVFFYLTLLFLDNDRNIFEVSFAVNGILE